MGSLNTKAEVAPIRSPPEHFAEFLPAATAQCHASNLLQRNNGDLLCAWFGGSQEGKPDISIHLSKLLVGAQEWSPAENVTVDGSRSEQNPVLFETPFGDIHLYYTSQHAGDQDSAVVKRQISTDGARSWSEPHVVLSAKGTFIRQPIVVLEDGSWLLPTFRCRTESGSRWVGNDDVSAVQVSHDQGQTWTSKEVPKSFGSVHMEIKQLKDKSYIALFRSRWADNIYSSRSTNGVDWQEPIATSLPNPNSGICFEVLPSGRVLVVYNHSSKQDATARREGLYDDIAEEGDQRKNGGSKHAGKEAFWGAPRAPLCLAWSDDDGHSWKSRVLEDGDGYCMTNNSEQKLNRELSYPSSTIGIDGSIHIAYTYWRQKIKHVRLDLERVNEWS
jgi:predicted neuraminidase